MGWKGGVGRSWKEGENEAGRVGEEGRIAKGREGQRARKGQGRVGGARGKDGQPDGPRLSRSSGGARPGAARPSGRPA